MSKEIIIDGVNVAECFYFIDHTPPKGQGDWCGAIHKGACKVYSKDCEYNKDCYYKQLKRLQAENETLKEELDFLKNNTYRKVLREIREYINDNTDFDKGDYFQNKTPAYDILRIIALYGE